MKQTDITLAKLEAAYKRLGYQIFDMDKPFNLNIFGIRAKGGTTDTFNDFIGCFYSDNGGKESLRPWPATTDPGKYYLKNLLNKAGCAVLVPNQYIGCWELGLHRNYPALKQIKPVKVYRVPDGNYDPTKTYTIDEGIFGINIHRADDDRIAQFVGPYSAGCQVVQNPEDDSQKMLLANKAAKLYGKTFSYTLLLEEEVM